MSEPQATETTPPERKHIEPGWYKNIGNEEYHGSSGWSSSQLKSLVEKTPAHLRYASLHPKESTAAMQLGTAVHTLTLEPETFAGEFAVIPNLNMRTNAGKADMASFQAANQAKNLLTESQLEKAMAMAKSVNEHPIAGALLDDIVPESSIYWWYKSMDPDDDSRYKTMVKVRPDALCRKYPAVIDVKSTMDGSYSGFIKSIQNFGYHFSAAMYLEGVNQCKPLLEELRHFAYTKFIFICVENTEPYLTSIYELSPEYLEIGKLMYRRAVRDLRRGIEEDWPGFPDEVRVIEPPAWARRGFIV